ncbi:hypothetical protein P1J78_05140 [Psychromarinibacter sp. C21-152]|uniref:Uncharacterized protein n=1 Tax=Psychromarinibacter sediminicola TaxID=3033385 RepID=A0AAE3NPK3_9RHOB|nr:hypothetical protein [Psychromarinibacter sediminicola]MDF0600109.1 hypothetical protein [Psychromarinibacter sediminicola]
MRRLVFFALSAWLGALPAAAQDCATLMAAFRVPEPPRNVRAPAPPTEALGCTRDQLAMFQKNLAAIAEAAPVAGPEQLYGTWLGDNVLGYVAGIMVPGQEVLRIAPGEAPGSLHVRQYWIKAVLPDGAPMPWTPGAGYAGLLSEGRLIPGGGRKGGYTRDYDDSFAYSGRSFEFDRSVDLFVKFSVNYFERPLAFLRDGDTLVIRYNRMDPYMREDTEDTATFTRVADDAPDIAILLVAAGELSQAQHFDCLSHQISEGQGPLFDALAPLSPAETVRLLEPVAMADAERYALSRVTPDAQGADWAERMQAVAEGLIALYDDPEFRPLMEALASGDLGCPPLY